jgi:hypothetical protein
LGTLVVIEVLLLALDSVPLFLDVFVVVFYLLDNCIIGLLLDGLEWVLGVYLGRIWGRPWSVGFAFDLVQFTDNIFLGLFPLEVVRVFVLLAVVMVLLFRR